MFVNAGTILLADDESELAGVMAHEIGHVAACHCGARCHAQHPGPTGDDPVVIMTGGIAGIGIQSGCEFRDTGGFQQV